MATATRGPPAAISTGSMIVSAGSSSPQRLPYSSTIQLGSAGSTGYQPQLHRHQADHPTFQHQQISAHGHGSLMHQQHPMHMPYMYPHQFHPHSQHHFMMEHRHPVVGGSAGASRSASPAVLAAAAAAAAAVAGNSRFKTELCRSWANTGKCRYGDKCQFAHGHSELRPVVRHPKYKTELCRTFHSKGSCPYGARCHYIHELQERVGNLPPSSAAVLGVQPHRSRSSLQATAPSSHRPQSVPNTFAQLDTQLPRSGDRSNSQPMFESSPVETSSALPQAGLSDGDASHGLVSQDINASTLLFARGWPGSHAAWDANLRHPDHATVPHGDHDEDEDLLSSLPQAVFESLSLQDEGSSQQGRRDKSFDAGSAVLKSGVSLSAIAAATGSHSAPLGAGGGTLSPPLISATSATSESSGFSKLLHDTRMPDDGPVSTISNAATTSWGAALWPTSSANEPTAMPTSPSTSSRSSSSQGDASSSADGEVERLPIFNKLTGVDASLASPEMQRA